MLSLFSIGTGQCTRDGRVHSFSKRRQFIKKERHVLFTYTRSSRDLASLMCFSCKKWKGAIKILAFSAILFEIIDRICAFHRRASEVGILEMQIDRQWQGTPQYCYTLHMLLASTPTPPPLLKIFRWSSCEFVILDQNKILLHVISVLNLIRTGWGQTLIRLFCVPPQIMHIYGFSAGRLTSAVTVA